MRMVRSLNRGLNHLGWNLQRTADYYSVLPVVTELERTRRRWERASDLPGVEWSLEEMQQLFLEAQTYWQKEGAQVPTIAQLSKQGYGEGYVQGDSVVHYGMLRKLKSARVIEVGSGLSSVITHHAGLANTKEGAPLSLTCIEPFPYPALKRLPVTLEAQMVQDVPLAFFEQLQPGDVLFIDSTHTFKIDSDVSYLFLEVMPRLKKGVWIHVHDIVYPFNYPYPADVAIFQRDWPFFWNEALALQALLCGSSLFRLRLSVPMIRHHAPQWLDAHLRYPELIDDFCGLWIEKIV
jgi:hypothetical protein